MSPLTENSRLDYLDATRAFALVLGIVFHASLSFMPVFMGWAVMDISTSPIVASLVLVCHAFRMETFFLLAGFLSHLSFHRHGADEFVRARVLRIVVPFVVGWFILRPLVVSGWIMGGASLRGDYDFGAGILAGFKSLEGLPAGIFTGLHLWFLYYLAMITALALGFCWLVKTAGGRAGAMARRGDIIVAWLARSRWGVPVLIVPTAVALWFMRFWGMDTPDQTLNPHVPVLLVYGGFFALGWMLSRQRDALADFVRLSASRWVLAGIGIIGAVWLAAIERDPSHPHYVAAHAGFAVSYALMMWSLVFLTLGVFKKFCA
ncbi:MAG TPA: acyltransferase family protein, partial [Opitutus sp.]|nr:acyltransferase family protein [Opitutus sp.]